MMHFRHDQRSYADLQRVMTHFDLKPSEAVRRALEIVAGSINSGDALAVRNPDRELHGPVNVTRCDCKQPRGYHEFWCDAAS